MEFTKFVDAFPRVQNAVDIFQGRWASALPGHGGLVSGDAALFTADPRITFTARAFGDAAGRLDGFDVLELGPLEGAHTFALEQLGAKITAVEGNAEAFIKCLIVKNIYRLKSDFLLGNFVKMLEQDARRYDMIFACGVLYHMTDPLHLLRLIADHTDRAFLWTHYYDVENPDGKVAEAVEREGVSATYYRVDYGDSSGTGRFWGGLAPTASWMTKTAILEACRTFGFTRVEVVADQTTSPGVLANFCVVCSR